MSLRLDVTREQALERAAEIVAEGWASFDHARANEPPIDDRLKVLLEAALPEAPTSALEVLEDARRVLDESLAQTRPRYFAFVGSSGLEIGVLGDLLASCFDVNLAVWAAAATEVEDQAIRWVAEFVGFPGPGWSLHERRHRLEHDGPRRGPRARDSRVPPPRSRECPGDALLLERGALLDRARSRDPRDRLGERAVAADRRRPQAAARGGARRDPGRPRRRPRARRGGGDGGHDADRRRRSDRCARRRLRRAGRLAARGRRLRAARCHDAVCRPSLRRPRPRRLGHARRAQVALPAEGVWSAPRPQPRRPDPGVRPRGGVHPA